MSRRQSHVPMSSGVLSSKTLQSLQLGHLSNLIDLTLRPNAHQAMIWEGFLVFFGFFFF